MAAAPAEHATLVRDATLYVSPGANSAKLLRLERGRDLVVLDHTNIDNLPWLKVFATIVENENAREVTGWLAAKGVIDEPDYFDAQFFGYSRREAEVMDPQIRLFHECVWEALEDAGQPPDRLAGSSLPKSLCG